MPRSHEKSNAKKESKTDKLNRISREYGEIQKKLDETDKAITSLEQQYHVDATSRKAYQKSTYSKLSDAYDRREALSAELQRKQAKYKAVESEPESSSSDESRKSGGSKSSKRSGSSRSSAPAIIGWDCGLCGRSNFTDPWELGNVCACRHQFCDDDNHCTVQWNP